MPKSEAHKRTARGLTPRETVAELDTYIIGQYAAKKSVAIALRNRARRQQLDPEMQDEIAPKNIIMIGPTGVGKTEIARRLSRLVNAPFVKVEITKYTEVGYVGRDVESMIRDLCAIAENMVKEESGALVEEKARQNAEDRIVELLTTAAGAQIAEIREQGFTFGAADEAERAQAAEAALVDARERCRADLRAGALDEEQIEYEAEAGARMPVMSVFSGSGMEEMDFLQNMLGEVMPKRPKKSKLTVVEAKKLFFDEEMDKLIDMDAVRIEAVRRVEEMGIVFIDEIDKIGVGDSRGGGPDVSRQGVQRDLLPIVEGTTVNTRYGPVRTNHILFIAAGAFNIARPSDLIPELQGRFPIRVELDSLTEDDFRKILTLPRNSLTRQYTALLGTEGVRLGFTDEAVDRIAHIAFTVNAQNENIGARRLHTIMEKLLEDILFDAPDLPETERDIVIDAERVEQRLADTLKDRDLTRYIL